MKENFDFCLKEVLLHEGLWADHPSDPGGATMKGITIGTYAQWKDRKVTKAELRAIPDSEVAAIYKRNYWDKVKGDDLPGGLDLVAFDAAVNSGVSRGAKWLQQALGVEADGQVGPGTLAAAKSTYAPAAIERAIGFRMAFLKRLKTWPTFGKGWTRRVEGVRQDALALAAIAPQRPATAPQALTRSASRVSETPKSEHERPATAPQTPQAAPAPAKPITGPAIVATGIIAAAVAWWSDGWAWLASWFGG